MIGPDVFRMFPFPLGDWPHADEVITVSTAGLAPMCFGCCRAEGSGGLTGYSQKLLKAVAQRRAATGIGGCAALAHGTHRAQQRPQQQEPQQQEPGTERRQQRGQRD